MAMKDLELLWMQMVPIYKTMYNVCSGKIKYKYITQQQKSISEKKSVYVYQKS